MNYLSVEEVTKSYGIRTLFDKITFGIDKGQKVAFIAKNGTGKSTFLKILAGFETQDSGNVVFRKGIKVGYLHQTPQFIPEHTIFETIFKANSPEINAIRVYEEALLHPNDNEKMQAAFDIILIL